jgi:hypothetical protein
MKRIIITLMAVLIAAGCSTTRAPSIEEHAQFVALVRVRLAQDQAVIVPCTPFKVTVSGRQATTEYFVDYATPSQAAFNPMKTEFSFTSNQWAIVEHRSNRSWLSQWK